MRSPEMQAKELRAYLTRVAQKEGIAVADEQLTYWIEYLIENSEMDPECPLEATCRWYESLGKSAAACLGDLKAAPSCDVFDGLSVGLRENLEGLLQHVTDIASEIATQRPEPKRGRKAMRDARAIARTAYLVFLDVTGREPTTTLHSVTQSGPLFVDFLAEIFRLLHVIAAAEDYTKVAIAGIRSEMAPEEKELSQPD